jgi:hypothetical protein
MLKKAIVVQNVTAAKTQIHYRSSCKVNVSMFPNRENKVSAHSDLPYHSLALTFLSEKKYCMLMSDGDAFTSSFFFLKSHLLLYIVQCTLS